MKTILVILLIFISLDAFAGYDKSKYGLFTYGSPGDVCSEFESQKEAATNSDLYQELVPGFHKFSDILYQWGQCKLRYTLNDGIQSAITIFMNELPPPEPPPLDCSSKTDSFYGWSGSTGMADIGGCAYFCRTDYSKIDGKTSAANTKQCNGQGYPSTEGPPPEAPPPPQCTVDFYGQCIVRPLENTCNVGTTYGQVGGVDVCVPNTYSNSTDGLDSGTAGQKGAGGDPLTNPSPPITNELNTTSELKTITTEIINTTTIINDDGSTTIINTYSDNSTSTTTTATAANGGGQTVVVSGGDALKDASDGDGGGESKSGEDKTYNDPGTGIAEPASWWESEYPDGVESVLTDFSTSMDQSAFLGLLDPLRNLPSTGSEPAWDFDANMGPLGNYSGTLSLPAGVWAFIRFCMLFSAAMAARKLVFGG